MTDRELMNMAREASMNAYIPYSHFAVGACRQFLAEFSPDMEVLCAKAGARYVSYKLSELLPHTFSY